MKAIKIKKLSALVTKFAPRFAFFGLLVFVYAIAGHEIAKAFL